jgi:multiple sugar transport system ATP-binding protein
VASVELRNVWKIYKGDVEAVKNVSWKCEDREFFSILGPSGCGKSSSLRMIAGLEEISKGQICFNDKVVNKMRPRERNVAMVFENWALYPNLSVYENIAFPLRARNMSKDVIDKKVKSAAKFLDLEPILSKNARRLSGGEMQRVSIGRAIVREPDVLIMDEPISHLDASLRARMREELKAQVSRLGVTTLYITHDQVESMAMADRIAVMNLGEIQQIGTPLDIYHHPFNEFVAGFIGEPPANFVDCDVIREGGKYFITCPAFRFELNDVWAKRFAANFRQRIRLGVRPEDICISFTENKNCCGLEVDFVEIQGDRTIITLKVEDRLFLSEVLGDVRPEIGQTIYVEFNQEHIHFFSLEDGKNVFFDEEMKN